MVIFHSYVSLPEGKDDNLNYCEFIWVIIMFFLVDVHL